MTRFSPSRLAISTISSIIGLPLLALNYSSVSTMWIHRSLLAKSFWLRFVLMGLWVIHHDLHCRIFGLHQHSLIPLPLACRYAPAAARAIKLVLAETTRYATAFP